jgi:aminopeptidase N
MTSPLYIDFSGKKILNIKLDEKVISDYKKEKGAIVIAPKHFTDKNTEHIYKIEIQYKNEFSTSGDGVTRTIDPEDKEEYIATDFEPFQAHTLFPCFDQPDLKATYQLSVDIPSKWIAVSNELIEQNVEKDERRLISFYPTKKLSPYLFFVAAGPYYEWKSSHQGLPLYLYARKSLAKYVDADNIFETTKKGLSFFSEYFSTPYPFSKYGQIFIPEFSWGGMENPGAVALNEKNIFQGPVTKARREGRDDLILHEMAHMWFGDLVTMKWWDDLWLNESFASYLATIAQDRAMKASSAWPSFSSTKNWGYWQDQLPTTHPINGKSNDVKSVRGNFDGITYAKGAASLKQLHFYVGEEAFKLGLKNYFQEFSFKNSTQADFIGHLSKAAKIDLNSWVQKWLKSAGPHRVKTVAKCQDNKISDFTIYQQKNKSGIYSPHRSRLGFYHLENNHKLNLTQKFDVNYDKAENQITKVIGQACPDFIWANLDDYDYALYSLDKNSLKHIEVALAGGIDDPLTRMMLWSSLSQMVRTQELSTLVYLKSSLLALETETDPTLLSIIIGRHSGIREQYLSYLTKAQRMELAPKFEDLLQRKIKENIKDDNLLLLYFDFYLSMAQTTSGLENLYQHLQKNTLPNGEALGPDRRWSIIKKLARNNDQRSEVLISSEEKLDPSTKGVRQAYAARVAIPNLASKQKFWEEFAHADKIGINKLEEAAGEFNNINEPELTKSFVTKYFKRLNKINWNENETLVEIYFEELFPGLLCSDSFYQQSLNELKKSKNLTPLSKRAWMESNDELKRCVMIRAYALRP